MTPSGFELIELVAGIDYTPTFISTDKRVPSTEKTSLGYYQIGELAQYGLAKGPVFRIEFVKVSAVSTATHVKVWAIGNKDNTAPIYPLSYFNPTNGLTKLDIWLRKFEFCDQDGETVTETSYTVVGYKKNAMPVVW